MITVPAGVDGFELFMTFIRIAAVFGPLMMIPLVYTLVMKASKRSAR